MVEAIVALGLGGVLGFVLGGPKVSARQRAAKATAAASAPSAPQSRATAVARTIDPPLAGTPPSAEASPRKATQTVRKFK